MDVFFALYRLPQAPREFVHGIIAGVTQCDVREVSMLQWLRWMAGDGSPISMAVSVTDEKLNNGMTALWNSLAVDANAEIALSADVDLISQDQSSVLLKTATRDQYRARVCIVAVGYQVMSRIEFFPGLDAIRTTLLNGQYIAPGFKIFLIVKNAAPGFMGFGGFGGSRDARIGWLYEDREFSDGWILMVAWGVGERPDLDEAQRAVRDHLPDAVVTATAGHDWVKDEYAQRINHFHRTAEALYFALIKGKFHGRVLFAGGDVTPGIWSGWIEGAIDSGRLASVRTAV